MSVNRKVAAPLTRASIRASLLAASTLADFAWIVITQKQQRNWPGRADECGATGDRLAAGASAGGCGDCRRLSSCAQSLRVASQSKRLRLSAWSIHIAARMVVLVTPDQQPDPHQEAG